MRRREFITVLVGTAVSWPVAGHARQPAMPVVGFLGSGEESSVAALRQGLDDDGYIEGQNVAIEYRFMRSQYERASALAADLVARQVSVIVAGTFAGARAAKSATTGIPIVFAMGDDPVKLGLVASLNRPGGNITGVTFVSPAIEAKRVELLHQLIPTATVIAALVNLKYPSGEIRATEVRDAATALGLQLAVYNASSDGEFDSVFATIAERRAAALLVTSDPLFQSERRRLTDLEARYALPTVSFFREFAEEGGLMSYGTSIPDAYRQAGVYAGRILNGEKPADLPVLQPTKFELIINLKTAKLLGITVPQNLLVAADKVIE
jgi:putative tryptophan/tyrosine transport system substrate-binding protein